MYLCHLELKDFRSLADETITLHSGVTVLAWENNAGKTTPTDTGKGMTNDHEEGCATPR